MDDGKQQTGYPGGRERREVGKGQKHTQCWATTKTNKTSWVLMINAASRQVFIYSEAPVWCFYSCCCCNNLGLLLVQPRDELIDPVEGWTTS